MATSSSGDKPTRSTRCARGCTLASAIAANLCLGMRRHFRTTSRYEWMFWDMG